ncbi:MAG: NAD(P)-dependent oxidoreductase [Planctomycetota bacterium]
MTKPKGIPVMLNVMGWRVLIVGGGAVAARRAAALVDAGAEVTVVAPEVDVSVESLGVDIRRERFDPDHLALGSFALVVVATNDPETNERVSFTLDHLPDAPLCNRADDGDAGDVSFMASHIDGPLTLAVHTGGASASAAATIRDSLAEQLDPAWPGVLSVARETRQAIQQQFVDPAKRQAMLRRLTDDAALAAYRAGGAEALQTHYRDIMQGLA